MLGCVCLVSGAELALREVEQYGGVTLEGVGLQERDARAVVLLLVEVLHALLEAFARHAGRGLVALRLVIGLRPGFCRRSQEDEKAHAGYRRNAEELCHDLVGGGRVPASEGRVADRKST